MLLPVRSRAIVRMHHFEDCVLRPLQKRQGAVRHHNMSRLKKKVNQCMPLAMNVPRVVALVGSRPFGPAAGRPGISSFFPNPVVYQILLIMT